VVTVSAAHGYDLTGALKFQTEFSHMAGFNSPVIGGNAPDGSFTFNGKSALSPGGRIQITFKDVKAQFKGRCHVGNTGQIFEIKLSDTAGGALKQLSETSGKVGADVVFTFAGDAMRGQGDYVIGITSATSAREWNLTRCEITVTPPAGPLPPDAVKAQ
jgi:hypothetical protein